MSNQTPNQLPQSINQYALMPEATVVPAYPPALDQHLLADRLKQEDGKAGIVAVVGIGALAAGAFGVYMGVQWLRGQVPEQVASPEDSEMNADTLVIRPISFDCRSDNVYGHDGSTARTKYNIAGIDIEFTGYGAEMTEGKSVLRTCSPEAEIDVEDKTVNGKPGTEIEIPVSSLRFESAFNEADTKVEERDPVMSQFGGGVIDAAGAVGEGICGLVTFGQAKDQCAAIDVISDWNNGNQADLARSLRVAVLDETQKKCAPQEWTSQKAAIIDSYRQQAEDNGFDPYSIVIKFVDDEGNETSEVPDFTRDTKESLYESGVLKKEDDGPEIEFSGVHCTPLEGGYQAKFPNQISD